MYEIEFNGNFLRNLMCKENLGSILKDSGQELAKNLMTNRNELVNHSFTTLVPKRVALYERPS